ncbi:MAG: (Fe-S)-binding protein [Deltaproteobacteria bacterium]
MNDELSLQGTRQIGEGAPAAFTDHFLHILGFLNLGLPFLLFLLWGLTILYPLARWAWIVSRGQSENRFDRIPERLQRALFEGIGQGRVVREPLGINHQVLFVSFIILFLGTMLVTVQFDTPLDFYNGAFYGVYKLMMDTAGVGLCVSSGIFLFRRYVTEPRVLEQPEKMVSTFENESGYGFPLILLFLVGFTGFMLEGARITAQPESSVGLAYMGLLFSRVFTALGAGTGFHSTIWWIHMVIVFTLLYSMMSTKLRHMVLGPINLFFKKLDHGAKLTSIDDFENAETFGVEKPEEYSWKQILDMASCLECGRCTTNCPTVNTQKALNPKHLVIQQREQITARHGLSFLNAQISRWARKDNAGDGANTGGEGGDIALNELGERSKPLLDGEHDAAWLQNADMINDVATPDVIWGCTSCGWCEEGCPVGIEHIQRIVDMRRNAVLMRAEFPQDLQSSFRGAENQGNPWGIARDQRAKWAEGLGVQQMAEIGEDEEVEILYWVGCAGSFDDRNQKTSTSLVKIMQEAGVKFGILGMEEQCTGEPARRLGNEYLYFSLASMNVETLQRYKFKRIVTQCPHCFNTIKNEYPDIGGHFEVIHTTEFIDELLESGRIQLNKDFLGKKLTMHDPCYLARHNDVHQAPRRILDKIPGMQREDVENSERRTFCCGAGGGQFWKEEEHGTARINETRLDQLMEAEPDTIAVGCPFCTTMMTDATKAKGIEDKVRVKDVVELVAESLKQKEVPARDDAEAAE